MKNQDLCPFSRQQCQDPECKMWDPVKKDCCIKLFFTDSVKSLESMDNKL